MLEKKPSNTAFSDWMKEISSLTWVRYSEAFTIAGPLIHLTPVSSVVPMTGWSGGSSPKANGRGDAAVSSAQASSRGAGGRGLLPPEPEKLPGGEKWTLT